MNFKTKLAKELVTAAMALIAMPRRVYEKYFEEEEAYIRDWCEKNNFHFSFSTRKSRVGMIPNGYFILEPKNNPNYEGIDDYSFLYHLDLIDNEENELGRDNGFTGVSNVHVYAHGRASDGKVFNCEYPEVGKGYDEWERMETENLKKTIDKGLEWIKNDYAERMEPIMKRLNEENNFGES